MAQHRHRHLSRVALGLVLLIGGCLLPCASGGSPEEVAALQRQVVALQSQVAKLQNHLDLNGEEYVFGSGQRRLGGGAGQEAADSDDHNDGHGEEHQYDVLVYLILMLIIGTMILHLTTLPSLHSLPYTVVLFVLGVACSLGIHSLGDAKDNLGKVGRSYEMWMEIDPHTLMFALLPMLLTGDAMTIDTSVAKRVSGQCLWLAGPGVLVGAFSAARFLHYSMQWEFLLCLSVGAILAATDPVAVVGLLKELGASPTLTVQIQGESLLNDGTAMVLFFVAYDMLKGGVYDVKGIFLLLFYMVGCSWFLGMVIGGVFSSWIRSASKRLEHNSSMIQISLTICCAYWSFVFSEGLIGISGVLSTVASGLVLADNIWPKVVSKEAMHEVWHTLEYLGNTVIFFLAGTHSST
jgi:NhaP-type Na+/H+ or K+/H+ antiporter